MECMIILFGTAMFLALCSAACAQSHTGENLAFAYATAAATTATSRVQHWLQRATTIITEKNDGRRTRSEADGVNADGKPIRCPPGTSLASFRGGGVEPLTPEPVECPAWPPYMAFPPVHMASDRPSAKVSHELYSRVYDACEGAGSLDQAIKIKEDFLRRVQGGKKVIERAFRKATLAMREEVTASARGLPVKVNSIATGNSALESNGPDGLSEVDESPEVELYKVYLQTFEKVGDRGTAVVLKCSLMSKPCGSRRLLEKAFQEVFPSGQN